MPGNVILITIDCLRADRFFDRVFRGSASSCFKLLAKKGSIFTQAVSNSSWTLPSFVSLFTSTYPLMHRVKIESRWLMQGVRYLKKERIDFELPLYINKETVSLAEVLAKKGYVTIGLHSNTVLSIFLRALEEYFQYYKNLRKTKTIIQASSREKFSNLLRKLCRTSGMFCWLSAWLNVNIRKITRETILPYTDAKETIASITPFLNKILKRSDKKVFLWVHFMDPHAPYLPPLHYLQAIGWDTRHALLECLKIYQKMYNNPKSITTEELKAISLFYDAEINYVEEQLGNFLDKLEELGVSTDNSYFILTADHGELLGEHDALWHGGLLYEELIRVPLIMAGPGIRPGTRIDSQVSLIDLAPTILDLLGFKVPPGFLGETFKHLFSGEEKHEKPVISEYAGVGVRKYSYRTRKWKYILSITAHGIREELYNLRRDPKERINMFDEADVLKILRKYTVKHIMRENSLRGKVGLVAKIRKLKLYLSQG